jgi:hypothetical protein
VDLKNHAQITRYLCDIAHHTLFHASGGVMSRDIAYFCIDTRLAKLLAETHRSTEAALKVLVDNAQLDCRRHRRPQAEDPKEIMRNIRTLAALVAVPVCLSSASAWGWDKTNTVKAYYACVQQNSSPSVKVMVIEGKCIEEHAAPIPLDKIKGEYRANSTEAGFGYYSIDRSFSFSAKNFVLTSVTATVIVDGKEQTVSQEMDHPVSSLEVLVDSTIEKPKKARDANDGLLPPSPPPPQLKAVTAAKGLEIAVD